MGMLLIIKDESAQGEVCNTLRLKVAGESLTARELLRLRVQQEVSRFNRERPVCFQALVYPQGAQETGKGFRLSQHRDLDWELQYAQAIRGFESGAITIYIKNKPVNDLDTPIPIHDAMEISFVKLSSVIAG